MKNNFSTLPCLPRIPSLLLPTLFLGSLFVHLLLPSSAFACSCSEKPSLEESLKKSSLIFVGRVLDQRETAFKPNHTEVRFTVFKKFKGFEEIPKSAEYVVVYTPREESLCGYKFSNGFEYLVFATGSPAFLKVNLCSRTEVLENAQLDQHRLLRLLDE